MSSVCVREREREIERGKRDVGVKNVPKNQSTNL